MTALFEQRSGIEEFEFEYGADFVDHIEAFAPTRTPSIETH